MAEVTRYSVDADAADAARAEAASGEEEAVDAKVEDGKPVEATEATTTDTTSTDDTAPAAAEAATGDTKTTEDDGPIQHLESLYGEWEESGGLSEESQAKAIETIFHPDLPEEVKKQLLEQHVEGLGTRKGMNVLNAYAEVGGEQQFKGMMEWAKTALNAEEIVAYDTAVSHPQMRSNALKGLLARYQAAVGDGTPVTAEPNLAHNSGASEGVPPIGSRQELAAIQRTTRYKTDPAYREEIAKKIGIALKSGRYVTV